MSPCTSLDCEVYSGVNCVGTPASLQMFSCCAYCMCIDTHLRALTFAGMPLSGMEEKFNTFACAHWH